MRISTTLKGLSAVAAVALLAGCSSSSSTLPSSSISNQSHVRAQHARALTGVAPQFLRSINFSRPVGHVNPNTPGPRDLAVSDFVGTVEILNRTYALERVVTDTTGCPDGDFYDQKGRLYDADYCAAAVTEYTANGTPIFTYTDASLANPVGVTTDAANNVYAVDFGGGGASVVVEFPQHNTTAVASCATGLANEGVAVDTNGAVFVDGEDPNTGLGVILEYPNGLAGCPTPTTLPVSTGFPGGMQIDKAHNLVLCDQSAGIDIIPPPYTSISSTIVTGASDNFHVALNRKNGKMFIADPGLADVLVLLYPSGTPFTVLGSANGLGDPAGVATNPYPN
jgi:DNA-binding beta-propeller fold protein YncE